MTDSIDFEALCKMQQELVHLEEHVFPHLPAWAASPPLWFFLYEDLEKNVYDWRFITFENISA